jgi:succinate-acetate transporter protein
MLTVPAIKMRLRELMLAFIFLIGLLVFLGLANLPIAGGNTFQKIGGVFAILSAIVLWDLAWKAIKQMMDEMARGQ